jgi:hypothetical protein
MLRESERIHYNKSLCEQAGGVYVSGYRRNGKTVSSYCRNQKRMSTGRMFREGFMIED